MDYSRENPKHVRSLIRDGMIQSPTAGMCNGFVQANLVILPEKYAWDFLLFCNRNPKPCPLLEVMDAGSREAKELAPFSDIAKDIPKYRIYKNGIMEECTDIETYWRNDFVSFLLGCSFTFESALLGRGIEIRHISCGSNVPMYITNIQCKPAGIFHGPMVVSMRPIHCSKIAEAVKITSAYPRVHGAPVHIGNPDLIGIKELQKPDYGDPVKIKDDEIPVFWACGVTPQAVVMDIKPEIVITHSPGHMFISDMKNNDLSVY